MINLNFFFWNYFILFTYIYIEIFYKLVFLSLFKNIKLFNELNSKQTSHVIFKNTEYIVSSLLIVIYVITTKQVNTDITFFSTLLFLLVFLSVVIFLPYSVFTFLLFNLFYLVFFVNYINSFIIFFLFIELYSILFYFIFLNTPSNFIELNLLKLKNMLLLYLIGNFFTSILLLLGVVSLVELYGTTLFSELELLGNYNNTPISLLLPVLGFLIKLALPSLHFLKLEIYKYLPITSVFLFSVITLFINYYLVLSVLTYNVFFFCLLKYKLVPILLCSNIFFLSQKLKVSSIGEVIAYSGFTTNNLILVSLILQVV